MSGGTSIGAALPVVEDRRCRAGPLDNPLRRWLAPPGRELDPLGLRPDMVVADLGAGVGYFARDTLDRIGPDGHLDLVDIDPENLAIARQRIGDDRRVTVRTASAAHVPEIPASSVDRVLLSLVLCCLVDKAGALETAWRILRPGGRAIVTYPRRGLPRLARGPSLRIGPGGWIDLVGRRPWRELPSPRGWFVHRHLLEKPP